MLANTLVFYVNNKWLIVLIWVPSITACEDHIMRPQIYLICWSMMWFLGNPGWFSTSRQLQNIMTFGWLLCQSFIENSFLGKNLCQTFCSSRTIQPSSQTFWCTDAWVGFCCERIFGAVLQNILRLSGYETQMCFTSINWMLSLGKSNRFLWITAVWKCEEQSNRDDVKQHKI